jgi:hypothetical protein
MKGGVEGAFLDAKDIEGDVLDVEGDGVAMHGALVGEGVEDEQVDGALETVAGRSGRGGPGIRFGIHLEIYPSCLNQPSR